MLSKEEEWLKKTVRCLWPETLRGRQQHDALQGMRVILQLHADAPTFRWFHFVICNSVSVIVTQTYIS